MSSFLVSKDATQLNPAQKTLLRALFGNHSVLQSLRSKIQEYEAAETGMTSQCAPDSSLGATALLPALDITPPSKTDHTMQSLES